MTVDSSSPSLNDQPTHSSDVTSSLRVGSDRRVSDTLDTSQFNPRTPDLNGTETHSTVSQGPVVSNVVMSKLEEYLKHYFGYDQFRPGQRKIIETSLQHQDALVIMPTGGGKSLCFQLPALLKPGLTLVVSPLISLMQDQVDSLIEQGIPATFLNSSLRLDEIQHRERLLLERHVQLLYISPERLLQERFLMFLDRLQESVG